MSRNKELKDMTLAEIVKIAEPIRKNYTIDFFLNIIKRNNTLETRFLNLKRVNPLWINDIQKSGKLLFCIIEEKHLENEEELFPRISMKYTIVNGKKYPLLFLEI